MNYYVSTMVISLSLFNDSEMQGLGSSPASGVVSGSSFGSGVCAPLPSRACDCCSGCSLYGVCDSDACGLQFPIEDEPFASTRFPNLGEYIKFLKKYGWG